MSADAGETSMTACGRPRVSVIIPIYNAASLLPTTVPSWLSQDHDELVLVDDGSADGSPELLEALTRDCGEVRVLRHEQNRGRAAARNTGIAAASGDVLLFLDADMRPEPDFVRQHALLHRDQRVTGIVSRPVLEGLDPADPYHRYLQSQRSALSVQPGQPVPFKYFIIGYTSVKASAVREVGGFDERFTYGEDLDLAYRLFQKYPTGLRYSDKPVVHHYDHGTLEDRLIKLQEFGSKNLPLLLRKHPGVAQAANLDFVDSREIATAFSARLRRWGLSFKLAAPVCRLLPYAPPRANRLLLRYLMASTIADAYSRSTLHH